jgi:hypothetical protein
MVQVGRAGIVVRVYVIALCALALVASLGMPDNRTRGYLDGTEELET